MLIGSTIKKLRIARGMSQSDLEHVAGLSSGNMSRIERDEQSYTNETISSIADALEVPVYFLFTEGIEPEKGLPLTSRQQQWLIVLEGLTMAQAAKFVAEIEAQRDANELVLAELAPDYMVDKASRK